MKKVQISVIIPTYNKGARLSLTLSAFCMQKTTQNFEIILIDGGEKQNEEAEYYLSRIPLRIIRVKNLGRSYNRNMGIKNANGEVLIFCDDDLIVDQLFIESHWKAHCDSENHIVHGWKNEIIYFKFFEDPRNPKKGLLNGYENRKVSDNLLSYHLDEVDVLENFDKVRKWGHSLDYLEKNVRYMFNNGIEKYDVPWLASCTANMSVRKKFAIRIGGFQEMFGLQWGPEDLEFGYRLHKAGGIFVDVPQAQSFHIAHARRNMKSIAWNGFKLFQDLYPEDKDIIKIAALLLERKYDIDEFIKSRGDNY